MEAVHSPEGKGSSPQEIGESLYNRVTDERIYLQPDFHRGTVVRWNVRCVCLLTSIDEHAVCPVVDLPEGWGPSVGYHLGRPCSRPPAIRFGRAVWSTRRSDADCLAPDCPTYF